MTDPTITIAGLEARINSLRSAVQHSNRTAAERMTMFVEASSNADRLTAELAAARAVPADVEAAILAYRDAAQSLGMSELIEAGQALRAAIARAIREAAAGASATVGGLLATAPRERHRRPAGLRRLVLGRAVDLARARDLRAAAPGAGARRDRRPQPRRRLPPAPRERTMTAYTTARARFESWAALDAPHLPADPVDAMQVRLLRWEQAQPFWRVSSLPVALGCGEEAGELADAVRHHEIVDAVGDVAIYACQVATRHRLAFGEILDAASNSDLNHMHDEWRELLSALGRVQHLILKREQRIRIGAESDEVFGEALADALARLIAAITNAHGIDARDAFCATAEHVLARNWTANPTTGAAAPGA